MAIEKKWRLDLRNDQCDFIIEAMNYIIARADQRINNGKYEEFEQFMLIRLTHTDARS